MASNDELAALRRSYDALEPSAAELAAIRQRLDKSLSAKSRSRRLAFILAVPLTAAAGLVLVLPPRVDAGFEVLAGKACVELQKGGQEIRTASCSEPVTATIDDTLVEMSGEVVLARQPRGLRLHRGRVRFEVRHRQNEPLTVEVAHGTIVVRGTTFIAEQHEHKGLVELLTGQVDFIWRDGRVTTLSPGQRLAWPRSEPPPSPPDEPAPVILQHPPPPSRQPQEKPNMHSILQRLFQLQSQQRYREAVEHLASAGARRDLTLEQRERLSFEQGTLLSDELESPDQACAHWRTHTRHFKKFRTDDVDRRLAACADGSMK